MKNKTKIIIINNNKLTMNNFKFKVFNRIKIIFKLSNYKNNNNQQVILLINNESCNKLKDQLIFYLPL